MTGQQKFEPLVRGGWTRADLAVVAALVLAAVVSWLPRTAGPIDFRWDSAVYYLLGTSIAENLSYRLLNEPGAIQAIIFPPLLPLLVAAHQWVLGTSDPIVVGGWLRFTFALVLTGYFIAAYAFLRTRLPVYLAAIGVTVCALGWYPHWLSDRCYSDLPFAVAAAAFLAFSSRRGRHSVASGLCAMSAFLLRTAGIALLTAWVADRVLAGDWTGGAKRLLIALIPVVAWQGYVFSVEHSPGYKQPAYPHQRAAYNIYNVSYSSLASLRDHRRPDLGAAAPAERVRTFLGNATALPLAFGEAVSTRRENWETLMERIKLTPGLRRVVPWAAIPVGLGVLGALVLVGLVRQIHSGDIIPPLALAVYAATICVMPSSYLYEVPRYLAVFAPSIVLALIVGLQVVGAAITRPLRTVLAASVLTFVIGIQAVTLAHLFGSERGAAEYTDAKGRRVPYTLFSYDSSSLGQDRAIDWLNQHADRTAIVVSSTPQWIYMRTGLLSIMPPMVADAAEVRRLLDAVPASYVVVENPGSFTGVYVAPVLRQLPSEWERVLSDPENDFEMYRRRKP